jgi:hypothetical protein
MGFVLMDKFRLIENLFAFVQRVVAATEAHSARCSSGDFVCQRTRTWQSSFVQVTIVRGLPGIVSCTSIRSACPQQAHVV